MKIGDRVICVVPSESRDGMELKKGEEYTIKNIHTCGFCDITSYDVGFPITNRITRCKCDGIISIDRWVLDSSRFVKNFKPSKSIRGGSFKK